jgi:hypothetical protein
LAVGSWQLAAGSKKQQFTEQKQFSASVFSFVGRALPAAFWF